MGNYSGLKGGKKSAGEINKALGRTKKKTQAQGRRKTQKAVPFKGQF